MFGKLCQPKIWLLMLINGSFALLIFLGYSEKVPWQCRICIVIREVSLFDKLCQPMIWQYMLTHFCFNLLGWGCVLSDVLCQMIMHSFLSIDVCRCFYLRRCICVYISGSYGDRAKLLISISNCLMLLGCLLCCMQFMMCLKIT